MLIRNIADFLNHVSRGPRAAKRVASGIHRGERLEDRLMLSAAAVLVKDINPLPGFSDSNPSDLTEVNGTLFFSATNGTAGYELWKSNGTASGTVQVKDIFPGAGDSSPAYLTNVNGILYFTANDGTSGAELWRSDGTAGGTVLVKDIASDPTGRSPRDLTNVNGTLYFTADDGILGRELWTTDGTEAGTVLIKDINPGSDASSPSYLTNMNGTLYFAAYNSTVGDELWKSDGTAAGTVPVKDIAGGSSSSFPSALTIVDSTLYFNAENNVGGRELWRTDGTDAGTFQVKDINPGSGSAFDQFFSLRTMTNVSGTLYFRAFDPVNGTELWKSDGTAAGTVLVKDIKTGTSSSVPRSLANVNGTLYFSANDAVVGYELWKSDGTTAGTVLVKDIKPGSDSSDPGFLTNLNGTLYFGAEDSGVAGGELWTSNGTAAGTVQVADILPGPGSSFPTYLTNINGTLYFRADGGATQGVELWKLVENDAAPTNISLSSTSIAENNVPNATIGTLSATDPDASDTFTFSFVTGAGDTDNGSFTITGSTLQIIPVTDFETKSSYSIRVQVTDHGGLSFEKSFTIAITNVDEFPTIISLNALPLSYHVSAKKTVAIDSGAILSDGDAGALTLNGATLQVSGQTAKDTLSILKQGGISLKGKNVLSGKDVIGTFAGGKKGVALTVHFTSKATQISVQTLLRNIAFKSTDKVAANRSMTMQITNIGGSNTNQAGRQIQVGP
ncbi:MAG: hypothetical protein JWM11_3937 [Planctomycetaceae bacterium]|nr:hypothetical protein [Planctomycetaceae bacterium]